MNFNRFFRSFTLFFSVFLFSLTTFAQKEYALSFSGSPYIQKIIVPNFGTESNNFAIRQSPEGLLIVENTNGLLLYNGFKWKRIKTDGRVYSAISENQTIIGAHNCIGILAYNALNEPYLKEIQDSLSISIETIQQIIAGNENIYFIADNKLYYKLNSHAVLIDEGEGMQLFSTKDRILLHKENIGLFQINRNRISPLKAGMFFENRKITAILPLPEKIMVITADNSLYFIDNSGLRPVNFNKKEILKGDNITCAVNIAGNKIALGTQYSGILILSETGNLQQIINRQDGLYDTQINYLFTDNESNLWAAHNHGISRIEITSPFSYFDENHGLEGNINSIISDRNYIYIATSQGVYGLNYSKNKLPCENCNTFQQVSHLRMPSYYFFHYNNQLFVVTSTGSYRIHNLKSSLFYNREIGDIITAYHSENYEKLLFLGRNDGLQIVRLEGGLLIHQKKMEQIKEGINSITEDNNGNIWLSGKFSKLYMIPAFEIYRPDMKVNTYDYKKALQTYGEVEWVRLYNTSSGLFFSTNLGLFHYDPVKNLFYPDKELQPESKANQSWFFPIIEDNKGDVWLTEHNLNKGRKNVYVHRYDTTEQESHQILSFNKLEQLFVNSIHTDTTGIIWVGGFEGLIRFDSNHPSMSHPCEVAFNQITLGKDSSLYNGLTQPQISADKSFTFSYDYNQIAFSYSAKGFQNEDLVRFQTKLEGLEESWSDWTNQNSVSFANLREGNYTLHLRAKNIYDTVSPTQSFSFRIKPPMYRNPVAYFIYIAVIGALIFLLLKWRSYYFAKEKFRLENIINERTEEVVLQKEKADRLLERVLPKTTAKELKSGKRAGPYHYNMVTVLFSDIQGFTKISEQLDSEHLIDELDKFFLKFDEVVEKYNIEKIKTIGDAYMCAGGIPEKNRTNPVEVVLAAMEMQNYMKSLKHESGDGKQRIWDLRIGIDTGPVVAGVLGRSKISYDIWGGTVNTASRMEASGEPGKINITENTYMLIKDFFICKYRGKMPVKYKGEIDMYFVESFMPEMASDIKGLYPNDLFFTQLQLLRLNDIEEYVLSKLENGLPDNLYYHSVKHTIDVVTQVELIGRSEKISDEDMLLLKTAALFHDMGHIVDYDTHEEESAKLAQKILPKYHYNKKQIEQITTLIMATRMPPQPQNLLEEIMCDADLDYLGRTDFAPVSVNLYKEMHERGKIKNLEEWNDHQSNFIKGHHYFTKTAQKLREVKKKKQLENIQEELNKAIKNNRNED